MSKKCPDITQQPLYDDLVTLLNGDYSSAYRMWRRFEDASEGTGAADALTHFKRPASEKIEALKEATANLTLDKEGHVYTWNGDSSIKIRSLSDVVRGMTPESKDISETSIYSELGTKIHDIFSRIVGVRGDRTTASINKDLDELGVPESLKKEMFDLYDELSKMGTILSEQLVYTENTSEDIRIGGTADIIIYTPSGKKLIVDLKTTYVTPTTRASGKSPFNPLAYGMQKAKLYSAQTMGYGRMTEFADGQPVSDHFIVPVELELNVDGDPTSGFKEGKIVKNERGSHLTNIKEWVGMTEYATQKLDTVFRETSQTVTTSPLIGNDDTSMIYENLTGDNSRTNKSIADMAREILDRNTAGAAPNRKFFIGNKPTTFIVQDRGTPEEIRAANIQQITKELDKTSIIDSDISHGIRGYIMSSQETGEVTPEATKFLNSLGRNAEVLRGILSPFVGRKDISVLNLSDIKGFNNKKNWIVIEEGKNRHLLYVGAEDLNIRFQTKGASTSLFGRHAPSIHTFGRYNRASRNTLGAARQLEGTLIAIKMKQANPDIGFGITGVFGLGGSGQFTEMLDMQENLKMVSLLKEDPTLRDKVLPPDLLKAIADPKLLEYKNYRADFMEMLTGFIKTRHSDLTSKDGWDKIWAARGSYSKDASKRQAMFEHVQKFINDHFSAGKDVRSSYETMLLSKFYMQLQDLDTSLLPTDVYRKLGGMASNISNPLLQKLNLYLNNSVNRLSDRFWKEYKDPFRKSLDAFFKSRGILDVARDRFSVIGDTPRHYDALYKKHTYKLPSGETVTVPDMEFVDEGSDAFFALGNKEGTSPAQMLIKTTNDLIQDMAQKAGISNWQRGRLPLVRAEVENRMSNIMRNGGTSAYSDFIKRTLVDMEDSFGTGDDTNHKPSTNIFQKQANTEISDPRKEMMGVLADNHLDVDKYYNWSTNLETMMDVFAIQGLRASSFNEIGASLKAVNTVYNWWKSNLLGDRFSGTIDWVQYANTINIESQDLDRGTQLNRSTKLIQKAAAIGLYAFNPATAVMAQIGNELTMASEGIANMISGTNRFKLGTLTKAKAIIASAVATKSFNQQNYDKIDLLMRKFRLFNQDLSSLLNGYHRYGDKTIFRSKLMFGMLSGGDWATRGNIMVAQMLEDGTWDAFSATPDGALTYDESKDERFNGKGKLTKEEGQALRTTILRENGQQPGEKLEFGYTEKHGNSMRALSNYLFGATDRESRSMMNYVWWGKLLGGSKNWFVAKYDRYVLGVEALGGGRSFTSEQIGEFVYERDPESGELVARWEGEHIEGILVSLAAGINYLRLASDQRTPLTTMQKNNITRFTSDLVLVMFMLMLASAIKDDDDETKLDDTLSLILRRSVDDLLVFYNAITLDEFLWTPIALSWGHQAMVRAMKAGTSMDVDDFVKAIPVADKLPKIYDMVNTSKFEITEE